jgi:hypothetical protein
MSWQFRQLKQRQINPGLPTLALDIEQLQAAYVA